MQVNGQLEKALVEKLAADPTGTGLVQGRIWYNTVSLLFKVYDGAVVQTFVDLNTAQTLSNKLLSGANVPNHIEFDELGAAPSNPAANKKRLYVGNDNFYKSVDESGAVTTFVDTSSAQTLTTKTLTAPVVSNFVELTEVATPATPASGFGRIYFKSDGFLYQLSDGGVESKVDSSPGVYTVTPVDFSDTPYTITVSDDVIDVSAVGGDVDVELPTAASSTGRKIIVKRSDNAVQYLNSAVAANVTTGTDSITITGHDLQDLVKVRVSTTTTLPSPLVAATDYWVIYVDANTIKLASSFANAVADTAIDLTTQGTGTHTITVQHRLVNVVPDGADLIDGDNADRALGSQGDFISLISDGTSWKIDSKRIPICARAVSSAGTSIPNTGVTQLTFDTEISANTYDTHAALNESTGDFTAQHSGFHVVVGCIRFQAATYAAGNSALAYVYKNGVAVSAFRYSIEVAASHIACVNIQDRLYLDKGDTIAVAVSNDRTAGATSLLASGGGNWVAFWEEQ